LSRPGDWSRYSGIQYCTVLVGTGIVDWGKGAEKPYCSTVLYSKVLTWNERFAGFLGNQKVISRNCFCSKPQGECLELGVNYLPLKLLRRIGTSVFSMNTMKLNTAEVAASINTFRIITN
jgi:hypothetical protein